MIEYFQSFYKVVWQVLMVDKDCLKKVATGESKF